jgi:hypothetical integral membrane protein (TIGR02206 family)
MLWFFIYFLWFLYNSFSIINVDTSKEELMNFFEYTSLDDTISHGLTLIERIAPLVILIIIIFLIYNYQEKLKNFKNEKIIRYILAGLMIFGEISFITWNFIHSLNGDVRFINTLPLQLCSYAIIGLIITLILCNKKVYNYVYIFGVVSFLALLFPNLNHGVNSFRYYQLYFSHSLLMIALFYMYKIHGFYPKKDDLIKSFVFLQILIVISLILNVILNTDFLFIGPGNKPIDFAWDWPGHMIQYEFFMVVVYFIFYKILKKLNEVQNG